MENNDPAFVIFVSVSAFGQTNEVLTNKEGKKGQLSNVSVLITDCSPKMLRQLPIMSISVVI